MIAMSLGQGRTLEIACRGRSFSFHFDVKGAPIAILIQAINSADQKLLKQSKIIHMLRGKRLPKDWKPNATIYEHATVEFQNKLRHAMQLAAGV
jgi:hypothetical protein